MIESAGNFIHGTHESPVAEAPSFQTRRTGFSGVIGESEIRQGRKGRRITCRIKIHNSFSTSDQLYAYIRGIDVRVGEHGMLAITRVNNVGAPVNYPNCTFEGFTKDATADSGPLPDYVGLLDNTKPSWWMDGTLQWYQLNVTEE
jgi:hypothetical protein